MKQCSKCKKKLQTKAFNKDRRAKDGLCGQCRLCSKLIRNKSNAKHSNTTKEYYRRNKKKILEQRHKNYREQREDRLNYSKNYRKSKPWVNTFRYIQYRCNNPNCDSYPYYGAKGIKNYLTVKDLEYLWKRDRTFLMDRPSIDRINSNLNYSTENCRYIEHKENSKRNWRHTND